MKYTGKSWDILRDIFFKSYGIYLLKAIGYICLKLRGILGKIMGYIMGYYWQYFEIIGYLQQQPRDILGKIMR